MVKLELLKWHEFKKNEAQVMWFRHTNNNINGIGVSYLGDGRWEYEGPGNYGALNPDEWQKPTRVVPKEMLREIISNLLKYGFDY